MLDRNDVREKRVQRGISMAEMAKMVEMSNNSYGDFENGKTKKLRADNEKRILELIESWDANDTQELPDKVLKQSRLLSFASQEFRSLADFLDDTAIPNELKARRLVVSIERFSEDIKDYVLDLGLTK